MDVSKCMRTKLVLAGPDCDYKTLLCKIVASTRGRIYVVDKKYKLLGIITTLDLLNEIVPSYMSADLARSITDGGNFAQRQVEKVKDKLAKEIMTTDFVFLSPRSIPLKVVLLLFSARN